MTNEQKEKLLKDRKVIEEINRHLWIESEKAGYDIGFDKAAADWMEKFSKAWLKYHAPKKKSSKGSLRNPAKSVRNARPSKSRRPPKSA